MKRRDFSAGLAAATLLPAASLPARAQGAPVEGTHFTRIGQPVPVNAPAGKVEVVEFFWYGCPHCNAFEPSLEAWARKLPPEVVLRRVHVQFNAMYEPHQRLFYALEAMGAVEAMHRKVFAAIHQQRRRLEKEAEIAAFVQENGVDGAKFLEVYKSFAVATKCRQAKQLSEAYRIEGVPTLGVQGRYLTSVGQAGSPERALAVTDWLVQKVRGGG